jgi:hypothetical protein
MRPGYAFGYWLSYQAANLKQAASGTTDAAIMPESSTTR